MFVLVILLLVLLTSLIYSVFSSIRKTTEYFKKNSISHLKCTSFLGNSMGLFSLQYRLDDYVSQIYNSFPSEKYFGMYDKTKPMLVIRDVDLVKKLSVKDFEYFNDRLAFIGDIHDSIFSNTLLLLKGQKWKSMRTTLNPVFSTNKMKQMFDLMINCSEYMIVHFKTRAKHLDSINVNINDTFYRYANDVIVSCAFGNKIDSFASQENPMFTMGINFVAFGSILVVIKQILMKLIPDIMTYLKFELFDQRAKDFYLTLVEKMIAERQQSENDQQLDMLSLLLKKYSFINNNDEITEQTLTNESIITFNNNNLNYRKDWTLHEITAQYFVFYMAGFESTSTLMSFTTYELALHEDVQNRLYNEIKCTHESLMGQKLTYEIIQNMSYLDMVISEVLRKWPPFPVVDRKCVKDYTFIDSDNSELTIHQGTLIWIPIYGIHRDPKYFENPEKFDPDRFSESNKHNMNKNAYLPFGFGPKKCIGFRFALLEAKIVLYNLLLNFQLIVNSMTEVPLKIKPTPLGLSTERPIYLQLKRRYKQ